MALIFIENETEVVSSKGELIYLLASKPASSNASKVEEARFVPLELLLTTQDVTKTKPTVDADKDKVPTWRLIEEMIASGEFKGEKGDPGADGAPGAPGAAGKDGSQGPQGYRGYQGPAGGGGSGGGDYWKPGDSASKCDGTNYIVADYNVGATAFYQLSDIRHKQVLEELKESFEKLYKIDFIKFLWKSEVEKAAKEGTEVQPKIGVSAQSLEEVFPELVEQPMKAQGNDTRLVNYDSMSALALFYIRELYSLLKQKNIL